jgi:putative membrane protein
MKGARLLSVAVAAGAIVAAGCSGTEGTRGASTEQSAEHPGGVGAGGAGATLSDDEFVRDLALKDMVEIELSRMALDKATNPGIKAFARAMVEDHEAAGRSLKSALSGQPIEWPAQLDEKDRETINELAKASGTDFERGYVKAMIEGHQNRTAKLESRLDVQSLADWKTAAAARTETKALPDPDTSMRDVQVQPRKSDSAVTMTINRWAADTYPIAQQHLDTARTLDLRYE